MLLVKISVETCLTQIQFMATRAFVAFATYRRGMTQVAAQTVMKVLLFGLEQTVIPVLLFEQFKRTK